MRNSSYWLRRQIAICLVILLTAPFGEAASALPQQASPGEQAAQSQNTNSGASKPGVPTTQSETIPDSPTPVEQNQSASSFQSAPQQQQSATPEPVGTAVAPYEKIVGVAASRPAGAAIAPAKQKRTRTILISVGVVVATAVAVGTVVALSKASPSQPH
ncbi:MAG TPA: hypothetical protein VKH40_03035 [Alloacidobacterium sp.]|nr:hypothetical protein [Alloacidobacterium sp.]